MTTHSWNPLDNAAKLFPAMVSGTYSAFFRLEVILHERIIYEHLVTALEKIITRFPLLQMRLKKGVFWYFFEPENYPIKILPLLEYEPCSLVKKKDLYTSPLWRLLVHENRLAVEFSHIITDGKGAVEIFRTLLCVYYEQVYKSIAEWGTVKTLSEIPPKAETEFSYKKYYKGKSKLTHPHSNSFRYPDTKGKEYTLTRIYLSVNQVKQTAKTYGATITEFIVAVHFFVIQEIYTQHLKKSQGLVRNLLLVNLRSFFQSDTLKNFFAFVLPSINFSLGTYSFEEIIKKVHHQIQEQLDKRELQQQISEHVSAELALFNRIVPRPLKNFFMSWIRKQTWKKKIVGSISNIGAIVLPDELQSMIHSLAFFPIPSMMSGKDISIVSYNDTLAICTGRYIISTDVEKIMAKTFAKFGVETTYYDW